MQVHCQNLNELAHISFLNTTKVALPYTYANTPFAIIKRQLTDDVEYSGGGSPLFPLAHSSLFEQAGFAVT